MKKLLLLISVLSLFAYSCNRDDRAAGGGTGLQQEEQMPERSQTFEDSDVDVVEPSLQEDSDMQRMDERDPAFDTDPALESDPTFESGPGMQEEQIRYQDEPLDTTDQRDSSMGSGTDTAPEAEPTDATGIQQ